MPKSEDGKLQKTRALPQLSRAGSIVAAVLLVLACLHCTRSIFFDNVSWIDLHRYALGEERLPFQERVAMIPVLRAADHSPRMQRAAAALDREDHHQLGRRLAACAEPVTAEKLACILAGVFANLIAIAILWIYGRKLGILPWLPPAIFLVILYASFAARYEEAYWYPYDLPHMLLFGAACLCLLSGRYWLMLALFALDMPMRETSIYLALVAAPFFWQRWRGVRTVLAVGAMVVPWLAVRIEVGRAFAHNHSETGTRFSLNLHNLALPLHWPQMASALGFLLIPVWMGRAYLNDRQRLLLWLMLPCLAVTGAFGMWIESRIALEWSMPIALMAAVELAGLKNESSVNCVQPVSY